MYCSITKALIACNLLIQFHLLQYIYQLSIPLLSHYFFESHLPDLTIAYTFSGEAIQFFPKKLIDLLRFLIHQVCKT